MKKKEYLVPFLIDQQTTQNVSQKSNEPTLIPIDNLYGSCSTFYNQNINNTN